MKRLLSFLIICILVGPMNIKATDFNHTDSITINTVASPVLPDSLAVMPGICQNRQIMNPYKFKPLQLIVPGVLIGVGVIGLESEWQQSKNTEIRDGLQEHPHSKVSVDDYMQYAPIVATYGLKLCGVKSMHGYADMTIIAGTAYLLTAISVYGVKTLAKVERPDGSSHNSFPSGHTATVFTGAELLRREYWNTSPWIGIAGYAVAAGTGFLRMYNNRHWLTDVIAGAGIGILSVEAAYWLYPVITKTFFRKLYNKNIFIAPYASRHEGGIACSITF